MPMWSKTKRVQVALIVLVVTFYVAILLRNLNESERRSLQLQEEAQASDQVRVSISVLGVDPNASEMTARLSFRLAGSIAQDEITPAADLKLFLNSVRGPQEFDFLQGQRVRPIVAIFPTDGNVNRYPFDSHEAHIRMLMTQSRQATMIQPPKVEEDKKPERKPETKQGKKQGKKQEEKQEGKPAAKQAEQQSASTFAEVMVGATVLQRSQPVAISPALVASIPGLKFEGNARLAEGDKPLAIDLYLRRADQVITVSLVVMAMMMALALSVLLMAAKSITSEEKLDLLPLSLSMTLLFGLPAIRDIQPGVPPVGAFGDYVSFVWAELLVAASAVIISWAWLRERRSKKHGAE